MGLSAGCCVVSLAVCALALSMNSHRTPFNDGASAITRASATQHVWSALSRLSALCAFTSAFRIARAVFLSSNASVSASCRETVVRTKLDRVLLRPEAPGVDELVTRVHSYLSISPALAEPVKNT